MTLSLLHTFVFSSIPRGFSAPIWVSLIIKALKEERVTWLGVGVQKSPHSLEDSLEGTTNRHADIASKGGATIKDPTTFF